MVCHVVYVQYSRDVIVDDREYSPVSTYIWSAAPYCPEAEAEVNVRERGSKYIVVVVIIHELGGE